MHQRSESTSPMDPDENKNRLYTTSSQAWWGGTGDNAISPDFLGESTSSLSSLKQRSGSSETKATKSQARGDDTNKAIQTSVLRHSDGNSIHEQQYATSIRPPTMGEYLTPPHLELIGNSIDYTPYPYSGSYYGGIMPAYRPQALVHSSVLGVQHAIMSLPLEVTEEPVYVNAKQYHGILRRRQSRAKAELEKKLIKVRKPYLHESRHLHAIRRARGSGGRFLNTKRLDSAALDITSDKGTDILVSANPSNSLGSQSAPSNSSRNAGSSTGHNEAGEPLVQDMHGTSVWDKQSIQRFSNCNVNVNSCYSYQQGFQM